MTPSRVRCVAVQSKFEQKLQSWGMAITPCDGDGNCLFRAVSLQVYGTQDHHALIRDATMSYMVRVDACVLRGGRE